MRHDWDLGGIYLAPLAVDLGLAMLVLLAIRPILTRLRFGDRVANAPLAEAGLYICIVAVLVVIL